MQRYRQLPVPFFLVFGVGTSVRRRFFLPLSRGCRSFFMRSVYKVCARCPEASSLLGRCFHFLFAFASSRAHLEDHKRHALTEKPPHICNPQAKTLS